MGKRHLISKEKDLRKIISLIPFWQDTPEDFIDYCVTHGRVRRYAAKQYVYFSYDESVSVFFLLKGRIQILLTSEFSEKIFRVLKPPAFFPEVIFDGKPYPHAALAIDPTEVLILDKQNLQRYLENHPTLLWNFYQALALDLRRAYRQIRNLALGDARLRLGAKLYALAHAHGNAEGDTVLISIPLSATELAAMCSLARESVSRILGELRELEIIQIEKKTIRVCNLEGLKEWIQELSTRER